MKRKDEVNLYIVGAGVSGLIAAQILESKGYSPTIIEATDRVGGRIKTDLVEGYQLDHGFQVMLEAYPKSQEYLDYESLELQPLLPGAILLKDGSTQTLGDPLRTLSLAIPTVLASAGSIRDKIKILKLNNALSDKSLEAIFNSDELTTLKYLKNYGFSDRIINSFFKPFFSGIFLEGELQTSSRMFEFIYKMFGEGLAVIPKAGIGAIADQLKGKLKKTKFLFNTRVQQITSEKIILEDNTELISDSTLIATEASTLVSNLKNQGVDWKSVDNLYFEVDSLRIDKPIIGLFHKKSSLINNIFYPSILETESSGKKHILSVSIVREHNFSESELIEAIKLELKEQANILNCRFLKRYHIAKALPKLENVRYSIPPTETQLMTGIFLAGDQQLNGSLNAAILSGEQAALGLLQVLEGGLIK